MKLVTQVLARPFADQRVRFLGNVEVGRDIAHADLVDRYHAVVYASGTESDRTIGIPGEQLPGCMGSSALVRWYNGHPDAESPPFASDVEQVVVVGAGNVALDLARVLARMPTELSATDVPATVLDMLAGSAVRDIHVLIRRGPRDVKFTPAEVLHLGELADADVVLHGATVADLQESDSDSRRVRQNLEHFRHFSEPRDRGRGRRIHLRFGHRPVEIIGDERVRGVVVESITGRLTLPAGLVVTAVGFRGSALPGLPFDDATGTVPHRAGRVMCGDSVMPGVYVTGWIKRGPSGVIGSNKPDGVETAESILADLDTVSEQPRSDVPTLEELLDHRAVHPVDWEGWRRLDEYEATLGAASGRGRVKVSDLPTMLRLCSPEVASG